MKIKMKRSFLSVVTNAEHEQVNEIIFGKGSVIEVQAINRDEQDVRSTFPHQIVLSKDGHSTYMNDNDFEDVTPNDERPTMKMPVLDISNSKGSRNYNLNKKLDAHTHDFERRLDMLCKEYGVYMETETFPE